MNPLDEFLEMLWLCLTTLSRHSDPRLRLRKLIENVEKLGLSSVQSSLKELESAGDRFSRQYRALSDLRLRLAVVIELKHGLGDVDWELAEQILTWQEEPLRDLVQGLQEELEKQAA